MAWRIFIEVDCVSIRGRWSLQYIYVTSMPTKYNLHPFILVTVALSCYIENIIRLAVYPVISQTKKTDWVFKLDPPMCLQQVGMYSTCQLQD